MKKFITTFVLISFISIQFVFVVPEHLKHVRYEVNHLRPDAVTSVERKEQKNWWDINGYFLYVHREFDWSDEKQDFLVKKDTREIDWGRITWRFHRSEKVALHYVNYLGQFFMPTAFAAIAFDAATGDTETGEVTQINFTHTASGSNRVVIVYGGFRDGWNGAGSATYGGTDMGSPLFTNATADKAFRLVAPTTGAQSVVESSAVGGANRAYGGAMSFTGANQTQTGAATATNTGTDTAPTVSITTTAANSFLVSHVAHSGASITIVPNESPTLADERYQVHPSCGGCDDFELEGSTRQVAGAGATSSDWTLGASRTWRASAIEVLQVAAVTSVLIIDDVIFFE